MMSENSMERQCGDALASLTNAGQVMGGQVMCLLLTAMWNANKATTGDPPQSSLVQSLIHLLLTSSVQA